MFLNNIGMTKKMVLFTTMMLTIIAILSGVFLGSLLLLSRESDRVSQAGAIGKIMLAREIDHLKWVNILQRFVFDPGQKELAIQIDPRKCGLGTWYYGQGRQEALAAFPVVANSLAQIEKPHTDLHASAAKVSGLKSAGQMDAALQVFEKMTLPSVLAVQKELANVLSAMDAAQRDGLEEFAAEVAYSRYATIGIIVIGTLIALTLGFLLARTITTPIQQLAFFADRVAGGNLDGTITMQRGDELGSLAGSLCRMVESIRAMIRVTEEKSQEAKDLAVVAQKAKAKAEKALQNAELAKREGMLDAASRLEAVIMALSAASGELAARVHVSEQGAEEQAARVHEAANAMQEMTTTVLDIARNAGTASEASNHARAKAKEGALAVSQTIASIQSVQTVSDAMKQEIAGLAAQAEAISTVMNVISDIADQTNLLALNAAIEAARAGEAGRGFSVVADEVRKLAEKTMTSTTNVERSISGIQQSVGNSIARMEKVVALIEDATGQANASGGTLENIVSLAEATASQIHAIAAAGEEQSATCESITSAVGEVSSIASRNAQAMRDAGVAVAGLATQAHNLESLIAAMKG